MPKQYLIQEETLSAIANAIRECNQAVGDGTHIFIPEIENMQKPAQVAGSGLVEKLFYEEYDWYGYIQLGHSSSNENFWYADYGFNNKGELVPVLQSPTGVEDDFDNWYYVGKVEMGGIVCDKWRKIEYHEGDEYSETSQGYAGWDEDHKIFCYTNEIVVYNESNNRLLSPQEFPEKIRQIYNSGVTNSENFEAGVSHAEETVVNGEW